MIKDKIFKSLDHTCRGYKIFTNGQILEDGYKPDVVLKNKDSYIILESEGTTSRKGYLGGMAKAAHFLQGGRRGDLIFVISPKSNTKAETIALHLNKYFQWLRTYSNLENVFIIEANHYYLNEVVLKVRGKEFFKLAYKVGT